MTARDIASKVRARRLDAPIVPAPR